MSTHPRTSLATLARAVFFAIASHALVPHATAQDKAAETYALATGLLNRGLHEEAAGEFRTFLDRYPNHERASTARYALAICMQREGDPAAAARELARLADAPPFEFETDAALLRARILIELEAPDDAATALAAFIGRRPDAPRLPEVQALAGEVLHGLARHDEAVIMIERAQKGDLEPDTRERAHLVLALALADAGRIDRARESLADFLREYPGNADAPLAALRLGNLLLSDGDAAGARDLLTRAAKGGRADVASRALLTLARLERGAGRPEESLRVLEDFQATGEDERALASIERARCLLTLGRAGEAREAVVAESPPRDLADDFAAWRARCDAALADEAYDEGDWARAHGLYVLLLDGAPEGSFDRAATSLRLALCAHKLGDVEEARRLLAALGEDESLDAGVRTSAIRALATIELDAGETDSARARLAALIALDPSDAGAILDRALAALAAGDDGAALGDLASFLREFPEHERAGEARLGAAGALRRVGRASEGIEVINAGGWKDNDSRARAALERAACLRDLDRLSDAEKELAGIARLDASSELLAAAEVERAQLAARAGDYPSGAELASRAIERLSGSESSALARLEPLARYLRGLCLLRLDRGSEALDDLAAVGGDADVDGGVRAHASLLLGEARLVTGDVPGAVGAFEGAIERADDPEVARAALLRLGEAYASGQQWGESRGAYERYLREHAEAPGASRARFGIAWALENSGDHEGAIDGYGAIASDERGELGARAQFQIGECLFALGRHDEAVRELLKVDILFGQEEWSAAAVCEAGRCLAAQGRYAEAARQFRDVTERFPESEWAILATRELGELPALPGHEAREDVPGGERSTSTGEEDRP